MGQMMGGDMTRMMQDMMRHGGGGGGGGMGMMPGQHTEGRIAFMKAELGITEAQLPQWNAHAEAMRASEKAMRLAMAAHMPSGMPTAAPAHADAMIAMMTARLEAMKAPVTTGKALYAVLTDAQKKMADEMLMARMGGM